MMAFSALLPWYGVQSAFIAGNTMRIGFVLASEYMGGSEDGPSVPGSTTVLVMGASLLGLALIPGSRKLH
jgi:hypothetical protein